MQRFLNNEETNAVETRGGTGRNRSVPVPARLQAETIPLDYLRTMTDGTGMIQHGIGGIPDSATGYTSDDNARAFLATVRLWRSVPERRAELEPLLRRYLQFMAWAQRKDGPHCGWFVNFVSYDRRYLDERGTEDCLGRCLWALGEAASGPLPGGCSLAVQTLFYRALPHVRTLKSPRAIAYSLIGLCAVMPYAEETIRPLAETLASLWHEYSSDEWQWFEPYLTYDNARFVEGFTRAALVLNDANYKEIADRAAAFLTTHSFCDDMLCPIGNRGWWQQGEEKALFDQQTIEAGAYAELYRLRGEAENEEAALLWYTGRNLHGISIYDNTTHGCFDALTENGVNRNQGAESILSLLLALA